MQERSEGSRTSEESGRGILVVIVPQPSRLLNDCLTPNAGGRSPTRRLFDFLLDLPPLNARVVSCRTDGRTPMYRRNIKHEAYSQAISCADRHLHFLSVMAQTSIFPDTPALPPQIVAEDGATAPRPQQHHHKLHHWERSSDPRTIDPVSIPVPRHSDLLGAIHEELEKHNISAAEAKLRTARLDPLPMSLPPSAMSQFFME